MKRNHFVVWALAYTLLFCGIERLFEGGTIVRAWLPYDDADSTERPKTMQPSERDETA